MSSHKILTYFIGIVEGIQSVEIECLRWLRPSELEKIALCKKGQSKKCFPTREGPWLLNTSTKQPSCIWLYYCNRIKKPHSVSFIKKYIISHLNIIKNELNLLVLSQSWHVSFSIYFCMIHFDEKTESFGWLASLESTFNQAMVASSSSHCIALMRLVKFDICFYLLYTGCFI